MKKIVLALSVSILLRMSLTGCSEEAKKYNAAIELVENADYEAAAAKFLELNDYKDSYVKMVECQYILAERNIGEQKYELALELLESLKSNLKEEDISNCQEKIIQCSVKYVDNLISENNFLKALEILNSIKGQADVQRKIDLCKKKLKYENFTSVVEEEKFIEDIGFNEYDTVGLYDCISVNDAEKWISERFYQSWYSDEGDLLTIDELKFDEKEYNVLYACESNILREYADTMVFMENGNNTEIKYAYIMDFLYYVGDGTEPYKVLTVGSGENCNRYYDKTPEQMAEFESRYQKYLDSQPQYSDQVIVERAYEAFMNKMRSMVVDPREIIYIGGKVTNSTVYYDSETKTYSCNLEVEYHPNPFDFYGFTWSYYSVQAEFVDTGSSLMQTYFQYY